MRSAVRWFHANSSPSGSLPRVSPDAVYLSTASECWTIRMNDPAALGGRTVTSFIHPHRDRHSAPVADTWLALWQGCAERFVESTRNLLIVLRISKRAFMRWACRSVCLRNVSALPIAALVLILWEFPFQLAIAGRTQAARHVTLTRIQRVINPERNWWWGVRVETQLDPRV